MQPLKVCLDVVVQAAQELAKVAEHVRCLHAVRRPSVPPAACRIAQTAKPLTSAYSDRSIQTIGKARPCQAAPQPSHRLRSFWLTAWHIRFSPPGAPPIQFAFHPF